MIQSQLFLSHGMSTQSVYVFILIENGVAPWFLYNFPSRVVIEYSVARTVAMTFLRKINADRSYLSRIVE